MPWETLEFARAAISAAQTSLDYLTGLPAQCSSLEPASSLYALLERLELEAGLRQIA